MTTKHAHIVTRVNASQIKRETIDGEDHYRIPSATLPDNVVMNGGLYPAEEIAKAYPSLEGTPAPLGHPMHNGRFIPASSPRAINQYGVGAWNENVRREGGRVLLDKVVNIRIANQTEGGRQLIEAIEKQEPIHTSTGLTLQQRTGNGESRGKPYTWVATKMNFDHDCFLLGEPGAATPEEGVGVFVNAQGDEDEVLTANLELTEGDEYTLEAMAEELVHMADRAERREKNKGLVEKVVQALRSAIGGAHSEAPAVNQATAPEGDEMSLTKEDLQEALKPLVEAQNAQKEQLEELKTNQAKQGETVDALKANADAADKAERSGLAEQAKAAGLEDADIESMTTNALKVFVGNQAKPDAAGFGYNLAPAFQGNTQEDPYDTMPKAAK